jgi:ABC-2 type transport system ATP-binding protein
LRKGKKLFSGPISDLSKDSDLVELSSENIDNLALALQEIEGVEEVKPEGRLMLVKTAEDLSASALNEALFAKGIVLSHLNYRKISLEKEVLKLLME